MPQSYDEKTAPFRLGPPLAEASVAALLLHGFTGSPWELAPLGEALATRGVHVLCPRLPGHGSSPEAMLWAGQSQWVQAATQALDELKPARRVVVIGLSMGGLLAMVLAARFPARVQGLVLLAPAMRLKSPQAHALRAVRHLPLFELKNHWLAKHGSDIEAEEIRVQAPLLPKYPLNRVLDLFELQDIASDAERRINCPSLIIGAVNDHTVETAEVMALHQRLPFSRKVLLQRGFHQVARDSDRALVATEVAHFIDEIAR